MPTNHPSNSMNPHKGGENPCYIFYESDLLAFQYILGRLVGQLEESAQDLRALSWQLILKSHQHHPETLFRKTL